MEGLAFLKFIPEIYAGFKVIAANYQEIIAALMLVASAVIALIGCIMPILMAIPGEQPEKFLNSCIEKINAFVAFISKYSKK